MAIGLTIAAVSKAPLNGSLSITQTANGRSTASFRVESRDGSYSPASDAEVFITEGATTIFGGLVDRPRMRGTSDGTSVSITTDVTAVDFAAYTERRYVNETLAAGTLKSMLTTLVANYLTGYGVTLHASQVDGPNLPEMTYQYRRLMDVLNELMTLTADLGETYAWRIDSNKVLRAYQPSTTAAPFDLVGTAIPEVLGDITVESQRSSTYANRVIVKVPAQTEMAREETFIATAGQTTFTLQYTLFASRGYITAAGIFETFTTVPGDVATWTFNAGTNSIIRNAGLSASDVVTINFDGTFAGLGVAEDAGEIASFGIWEKVLTVETVPSNTTAQLLAEAELARRLPVAKWIKYKTLETGLETGQIQTVTIARRNLNTTAVVSDIVIRDVAIKGLGNVLVRDVTAVVDASLSNLSRRYADTYRIWNGDKTGANAAITVGTGTSPGGGTPSLPFKSVQFNNSGSFGGSISFTFDVATRSLVCGLNSSIDIANAESCQAFGEDCHIG